MMNLIPFPPSLLSSSFYFHLHSNSHPTLTGEKWRCKKMILFFLSFFLMQSPLLKRIRIEIKRRIHSRKRPKEMSLVFFTLFLLSCCYDATCFPAMLKARQLYFLSLARFPRLLSLCLSFSLPSPAARPE